MPILSPARLPLLLLSLALAAALTTIVALLVGGTPSPSASASDGTAPSTAPTTIRSESAPASTAPAPLSSEPLSSEPSFDASGRASGSDHVLSTIDTAFGEYLAVSDAIAADGGVSSERISPHVTEEFLPIALQRYSALTEGGFYQMGSTSFDSMSLVSRTDQHDGSELVTVSVCLDSSAILLANIDGPGLSLVAPETPRAHVFVDFDLPADPAQRPRISDSFPGGGTAACG